MPGLFLEPRECKSGLFFARFLDSHLQKCSQKLSFGVFYWVLRGNKLSSRAKKLSFLAKFHSVLNKVLSFQIFLHFYRSKLLQLCLEGQKPLYYSVVNMLKIFLTFGVAKNREKLSSLMKFGSVSAKNWVLVKYWVFWRIQFWP